jgi:transketolase
MPMGCAPIAFLLYSKIMNHNPKNSKWLNRDRFILSAGHGSTLLYGSLHLSGYNVPLEQIQQFRQWDSITPGHPEYGTTDGVETTTGPLGQGFANAVGMAWAQAHLASRFNKDGFPLLDHFIYGICGDGDMMEGVSHEAASLAGHLKLGKIIFFYDDNGITIDGETKLAFSENVAARFEAYGWHVQKVSDVNDLSVLEKAVTAAQKDPRPSFIVTKTHIGYGSPNKQDTESVHGSPLGAEEVKLTKQNLGWDENKFFFVPDEVRNFFNSLLSSHQEKEDKWNAMFAEYKKRYPDEAKLFLSFMNNELPAEWEKAIPQFADDGKKLATRQASGKTLNALVKVLPNLFGGSADLAPSNNTFLSGYADFSADDYTGKNLHFGIREHAMASIMNGMVIYGGLVVYGGTFLVFSDYLKPAVRIAALSHIRPIYVFTHDTIGLGEDGPTHQPVEQLAALRAIPNSIVIRPADANETAVAWKVAINSKGKPVSIILTRQGLPVFDQTKYPSAENLAKGAYVLSDSSDKFEAILIAAGSEVHIMLAAQKLLAGEGIHTRVVSIPSWELFEAQSKEYKESVLPSSVIKRVAMEPGVGLGWHRYTGMSGTVISLERFGASAPFEILYMEFGFTAENVVKTVKSL